MSRCSVAKMILQFRIISLRPRKILIVELHWSFIELKVLLFYSRFPHLLWWDLVRVCPQVHLLVDIHTGDDKEDPRAPGTARQKTTQPEDDGPLVLLDHLHHEEEGEWQEDENEKTGETSKQSGANTRPIFTIWWKINVLRSLKWDEK